MDMVVRSSGEPRVDLGGFVGGIVIHDDVDIEPFGDVSVDLFEEVQELGRPVTNPEATSSAANSEVVPCRT